MAAISKRLLHLHLRPSSHSFTRPYPYTHRHFSSSSSDHDDAPKPETPPPPPAAEDRPQPPRIPFSFPSGAPSRTPPPSGDGSVSDLSQRLANFRSRSAPPPPSSGDKYISLQELYEKNRRAKGESYGAPPSGLRASGGSGNTDAIRESLSSLGSPVAPNAGGKSGDSLSLSRFADSRMKAGPNGVFAAGIGGSISHFRGKGKVGDGALKTAFQKEQELLEIGKKLQALRPEKRKGKWFSLQEFSNRVAKLKMVELKQREVNQGLPFAVSDCLWQLTKDSELKEKQRPYPVTVGVLGSMGSASLVEKLGPPQDHLYEQYFHPDLMSSAEKLKLELAKVRDEFKMSESDCGSARVQVAQLTTKIKHLSTALHKKDKHSRRGLLAMVQRRKKLLKYLRRTDWESYSFVLSKLGLRDNPDIKAEAPVLR